MISKKSVYNQATDQSPPSEIHPNVAGFFAHFAWTNNFK